MRATKESTIERNACKRALMELGIRSSKFVTPGDAGYPDRIFWIPGGKPLFIEFKAPGAKPRPLQVFVHEMLRSLGYQVEVCDNEKDTIEIVKAAALEAARLSEKSRKVSKK